jgi:prophage maintenance system killer protein
MLGILLRAGLNLTSTEQENYDFVIDLATGQKRFEEAVEWLRAHSAPR